MQWTLYRCAEQEPERRLHALYGHVHRMDVLWRAWSVVCANRGAPGVDGVSVDAVAAVVADLNPVLRGWAAYFRNGNSGRKFNAVDGYVHERPAIFASRKHGLKGRNWTTRSTCGWIIRLGVYRLTGNVRGVAAHAQR